MSAILTQKEHLRSAERVTPFPWGFFLLAIAFTWLVCLPGVLAARGVLGFALPAMAVAAVAQFGSSLAGFIFAYREGGKKGALELLKRAFQWRIPLRWLVSALLLAPALAGSALALHRIAGGQLPPLQLLSQPIAILPYFIFIFFMMGPEPEEFGWRGYALDRLQSRWNALASSLILGTIWAVWHLPSFYMDYFHSHVPFWGFLVQAITFSVLITWLYNNTGRNLLVAMLFHASVNLSTAVFPPFDLAKGGDLRPYTILTILYILVSGLVVIVWGAQTLRRKAE